MCAKCWIQCDRMLPAWYQNHQSDVSIIVWDEWCQCVDGLFVLVDKADPYASMAAQHFNELFERYGTPVIALNLVKVLSSLSIYLCACVCLPSCLSVCQSVLCCYWCVLCRKRRNVSVRPSWVLSCRQPSTTWINSFPQIIKSITWRGTWPDSLNR